LRWLEGGVWGKKERKGEDEAAAKGRTKVGGG